MTTPQYKDVALDLIDPNPDQQRSDPGDLGWLVDSIRSQGVIQPVVLVKAGERYTVIVGHSRVEASILAGLTTIPATVHESADERAQIGAIVAENAARRPVSALDESNGIQLMMSRGWADPGAAIGRSKEHVEKARRIASMPGEVKQFAQQATFDEAFALAEFADDPKVLRALTKAIGTPNFDYAVQVERSAAKDKAEREAIAAPLKAAGIKIVKRNYMGNQKALTDLRDADGNEITPEAHASCPGHCVAIERVWDGDRHLAPVYLCADFREHGHATIYDNPQRDAERAKKAEEQAKRDAEWGDATAVRLAFVRKLVRGKLPSGLLPWAFDVLVSETGYRQDRTEDVTEIWGRAPGIVADKHAPGLLVALAVVKAEADMSYRNGYTNGYLGDAAGSKRYLELLMTEDYALSKPERAYYDRCVEALKPQPDDEDADECTGECDACTSKDCQNREVES